MGKVCKDCNKKICYNSKGLCRSCSKLGQRNPMSGRYGNDHHNYKGGYIHPTLGYKIVMDKNKKVYEHRLVMENYLGRELSRKEIVHHINGNKVDNRVENLEITNQSDHTRAHIQQDGHPMQGIPYKGKRDNNGRFIK